MKHDAACELQEHKGTWLHGTCHCAERAYARNPFVGDDGPVLQPPG